MHSKNSGFVKYINIISNYVTLVFIYSFSDFLLSLSEFVHIPISGIVNDVFPNGII